jgi:hypothetical protein
MAKKKASDSSTSKQLPTYSDATDQATHAPTDIRAWHQKLVARGNRLRELATRELESSKDHPS